MFKELKNYIFDEQCKISFIDNKVNIINYEKIIVMEKTRVNISTKKKNIIVKGNNLLIKKLLDKELLIEGDIKSIELE
ncbi:MAG: YabP/YqfC family sporulation protein [bacterium]|nr:YabP/YqfC family sporulation protein [bacterium]